MIHWLHAPALVSSHPPLHRHRFAHGLSEPGQSARNGPFRPRDGVAGRGITVSGVGGRIGLRGLTVNGQGGGQINTSYGVPVRALIRGSLASANSGHRFAVFSDSGRTALVTLENSGAFVNFGRELSSAAVVRSLQNNTIEDSGSGPTSPGITNGTLI